MQPTKNVETYLRLFEPMDVQFKLDLIAGLSQSEGHEKGEQQFWELMELIDWSKEGDEQKVQPLKIALQNTSASTIQQFSEQLAQSLHQLDGPQYFDALRKRKYGISADTFLYARCWVVAKGKSFYEDVLKSPEKMSVSDDFEVLLYVGKEAYEQATSEAYDFIPSVMYESFFNKKLWKEKAIQL